MENRYLQTAIMSGLGLIITGGAMGSIKHSTQIAAVAMSIIFGVFSIFSIIMLIRDRLKRR